MTEAERNALVEKYLPLVQKIASGVMSRGVPGCVELSDVVQDAVMRLIPELERYKPKNGACLDTYLHWVIRRDVIDSMRRQMPRDRYGLAFTPVDTHPTWIHRISLSNMKKCLTAKQLEAVKLVYGHGFTQERAAEKLGIHRVKLAERLSRAISRLKFLAA